MKINLVAKKINEVDLNISIELTQEELIESLKHSSENLKTIIYNRNGLVASIKDLLNCYTENNLKTMRKIESL